MSKKQEYFKAVEKWFAEEGLEKPVRPEGHTWAGYPPHGPAVQPVEELPQEALDPDPEYPYVADPPLGHEAKHGHWYRGLWFALEDSQPYQENINFFADGHPYERRWYRATHAFTRKGQRIDTTVDARKESSVKIKETSLPPAVVATSELYDQPPQGYKPHQGHWFQERWYRWTRGVPLLGLTSSATLGHIDEGRWYPLSVGITTESPPSVNREDFTMKIPSEVIRPLNDLEEKLIRDTILFIEQNIDREGMLTLFTCSAHGSIVLPNKVCREVMCTAKKAGYIVVETNPLHYSMIKLPFLQHHGETT